MRWLAIALGAWLTVALVFSLAFCAAARRCMPKPDGSSARLAEAEPIPPASASTPDGEATDRTGGLPSGNGHSVAAG